MNIKKMNIKRRKAMEKCLSKNIIQNKISNSSKKEETYFVQDSVELLSLNAEHSRECEKAFVGTGHVMKKSDLRSKANHNTGLNHALVGGSKEIDDEKISTLSTTADHVVVLPANNFSKEKSTELVQETTDDSPILRSLLNMEKNKRTTKAAATTTKATGTTTTATTTTKEINKVSDKQCYFNEEQVTSQNLDLMIKILDNLRDDDLDRLLPAPDKDDQSYYPVDARIIVTGSPAISQTDSGFANGSVSCRSIDDADEFGPFEKECSILDFQEKSSETDEEIIGENLSSETTTDKNNRKKSKIRKVRKTLKKPKISKKLSSKKAVDKIDIEWLLCPIQGCGFWTRKPDRMLRHRKCHVDGVKSSFRCPDCGVKFYSLSKLLRHDRKVHTGVKDYECRLCNAEVTDIQVHMRVHREGKEFRADIVRPAFDIGVVL